MPRADHSLIPDHVFQEAAEEIVRSEQAAQPEEHPFVRIERRPDPDGADGVQLHIQAGGPGLDSADEIAALLLLTVEQLTGVAADLYAAQIEITRRVARGGPLFPPDLDHDED
ncbi:hypothetical protein AB0M91_19635 [Micromonospora rifamycinica]|uniref:hypothetical protein n=1 Tax=Micromonospora rifamycinica TaxID=291594 RepID=UPI003446E882